MEQRIALQDPQDPEMGFEVAKILAQAGYRADAPAFVIRWGQIAELLAQLLAGCGLTPDRIDAEVFLDLARGIQTTLEAENGFALRDVSRRQFVSAPEILALLELPEIEDDDEGPLTELYENATRLGDDEAYWVDGGASADLFDGE